MPTWLELHKRSEEEAAEAELAQRRGEVTRAQAHYERAGRFEQDALRTVDPSKPRTLGVTAVSAVALLMKAQALAEAERLAYKYLSTLDLPEFAVEELRLTLHSIWSERTRQRAPVKFSRGEVYVSVHGGEVVEGGAPLDLIMRKVETVQALFFRIAEWLAEMPHRVRGFPSEEIQRLCRPWLFQAPPGSYQFSVAVQEPEQFPLFRSRLPGASIISDTFLAILQASAIGPTEQLAELVPASDYRSTFLKLTRNLAPTGRAFNEIEVRSPALGRAPISLIPETRRIISNSLQREAATGLATDRDTRTIFGILRAVHLDEDWLEVVIGNEKIRVHGVGDAVDDIIGPMVNHRVQVEAASHRRGWALIDIQSSE